MKKWFTFYSLTCFYILAILINLISLHVCCCNCKISLFMFIYKVLIKNITLIIILIPLFFYYWRIDKESKKQKSSIYIFYCQFNLRGEVILFKMYIINICKNRTKSWEYCFKDGDYSL